MKFKKTLKIALIFIPIILVIFCWKPVVLSVVKWKLNKYCTETLHVDLKYDNISIKGGALIIENIAFNNEKIGYKLAVDKACIDYSILLSKKKIHFDVSLERPQLITNFPCFPLFDFSSKNFSLFSITATLQIKDGSLEFLDRQKKTRSVKSINLFLKGLAHSQGHSLSLNFDSSPNDIEIKTYIQPYKTVVDVNFNNVQLPSFYKSFCVFSSPLLSDMQITNGFLSGNLCLTHPKDGLPYFEGELDCTQLNVNFPNVEFSSIIKSTKLMLSKKEHSINLENASLIEKIRASTNVQLKILDGSSLALRKDNKPHWNIKNFLGDVELNDGDPLKFSMKGSIFSKNAQSALNLDGLMDLQDDIYSLRLGLHMQSAGHINSSDISAEAQYYRKSAKTNLKAQFFNLDQMSLQLLKEVIRHPVVKDISPLKANIGGNLELSATKGKINSINFSNLLIKETEFSSSENHYHIGSLTGSGRADFVDSNTLNLTTLDLDVTAEKIDFLSKQKSSSFVNDLSFETSVSKGFINSLKMDGFFSGLNTQLELNESTKQSPLNLAVSGKTDDIISFMSKDLLQKLGDNFKDSNFELNLTAFDKDGSFDSNGKITIHDKKKEKDDFTFSCSLQKKEDAQNFAGMRSFDLFVETITSLFPFSLQKLHEKFILSGNLSADGISLIRYVAPFLTLKNDSLKLSGYADFEGELKDGVLVLNYRPFDAELDSPYFKISFKNEDTNLTAVHRFDLINWQHSGLLPLTQSTYLEKISSILFENLTSSVYFENNTIHCTDIDTASKKISLAGNVDVDFEDNDQTYLEIHFMRSHGNVQDVFNFISHFDAAHFWTIPLNGNLTTVDNGFYLKASFLPDDTIIDSYMKGSLDVGSCHFKEGLVVLDEMKSNFEYDKSKNKLEITDIDAVLSVKNDDSCVTKHIVHSLNPMIVKFDEKQFEFDFMLDNHELNPIRVACDVVYEEDDLQKLDFVFSPLTHFGDLYPRFFELTVDKQEISNLKFESEVNLAKLPIYLKRLENFGFSLPFKKWEIFEKPIEGKMQTKLNFCAKEKLLDFDLNGVNLLACKRKFNKFIVQGERCYNHWTFKNIELDDLNLTADLTKWEDRLSVNFIKVKYGDSISSHLHGEYFLSQNSLHAQVDNLTLNLEKAGALPWLSHLSLISPKGIVEAKGDAVFLFDGTQIVPSIDSTMCMNVEDLSLQGIPVVVNEQVQFHLSKENECSMTGVDLTFDIDGNKEKINLEKLNYSWDKKEWVANNCAFAFSLSSWPQLMKSFAHHLPYEHRSTLYLILEKLGSNSLSGVVKQLNYHDKLSFSLELDANDYSFLNKQHAVTDFLVDYQGGQISNSLLYKYNDAKYLVKTDIDLNKKEDSLFLGTSCIYEKEDAKNKSPMTCHWQWGKRDGFSINRVNGFLAGIKTVLVKSTSPIYNNKIGLVGKVEVDFSRATKLLNPKYAKQISSLKFGKGYTLNGYFYLPELENLNLCFEGKLSGHNFELLSNSWNLLEANIDLTPDKIHVKNFKIDDKEGRASCDKFLMVKKSSEWFIDVPLAEVNGFNFRAIKNYNKKINRINVFAIDKFKLENLKGSLSKPKEILGNGKLTFVNTRKKTIEKSLFAIPHEIISTIGFNPALLIPVSGTLTYEIRDGKVMFLDLGNAYSKGKRSWFYLAKGKEDMPYIDFSGDIDINVKIKQHNIFFKLAELLTISINGTCQDPKYKISGKKRKKTKIVK